MKIKAEKGTRDYLPQQVALREYMERTILSCYSANGFQRIMTPAIECIENLDKSDGGDNLNLIFKIMKRGEKLERALAENDELCDLGLRYDLTLPLTRYIAANRAVLEMPFKCIQMGNVYRAERPQKGRLREFVQCDIDIIGDNSTDCEVELITVTAAALKQLGIGEFTVKINDRQVLNALLCSCGVSEEQLVTACVTLDKLDKIGMNEVIAEFERKGFSADVVEKLKGILVNLPMSIEEVQGIVGEECTERLSEIISNARVLSGGEYKVEYDLSLVRGQSYYTGTIFEISSDKFKGAIAGGGRYDNLIGKFIGENVAACGFSIGFERIFELLQLEAISAVAQKIAYIYDGSFVDAYKRVAGLREGYNVSLFRRPKKLKGFLDRLAGAGFVGFMTDDNADIKLFDV